jgi:hypothetical protein
MDLTYRPFALCCHDIRTATPVKPIDFDEIRSSYARDFDLWYSEVAFLWMRSKCVRSSILFCSSCRQMYYLSCIIPPSKTRQRQPVFRLTIYEPTVTANSYELLGWSCCLLYQIRKAYQNDYTYQLIIDNYSHVRLIPFQPLSLAWNIQTTNQ